MSVSISSKLPLISHSLFVLYPTLHIVSPLPQRSHTSPSMDNHKLNPIPSNSTIFHLPALFHKLQKIYINHPLRHIFTNSPCISPLTSCFPHPNARNPWAPHDTELHILLNVRERHSRNVWANRLPDGFCGAKVFTENMPLFIPTTLCGHMVDRRHQRTSSSYEMRGES